MDAGRAVVVGFGFNVVDGPPLAGSVCSVSGVSPVQGVPDVVVVGRVVVLVVAGGVEDGPGTVSFGRCRWSQSVI